MEKAETKEGWSFRAPDEDAVTGYQEELPDFVGAVALGQVPKSDLMLATDVLAGVYAGYVSAQQGVRLAISSLKILRIRDAFSSSLSGGLFWRAALVG